MRHALLSLSFSFAALLNGGAHAGEPQTAVFAGGCFWCVEADFDKLDGVLATTSGFAGGSVEDPSYKQVTRGGTGHLEVVEITYDPDIVSFRTLAGYLLRHVDPTDDGGQFCDRGDQYRTAVFVGSEEERAAAGASKTRAERTLKRTVVTPVLPKQVFWLAEEYHQDFYKKNPTRYKSYRAGCGRDHRLQQLWGAQAGR